jgi:hypothetical protein
MMVDAAIVDAAYVDGAYPYIDLLSIDIAEVEWADECPANWALGLRMIGALSIEAKDELLLDMGSKCPDLFSRSVAVRANPESPREIVVAGIFGKCDELGDTEGGGLLAFVDRAVCGRSTRV